MGHCNWERVRVAGAVCLVSADARWAVDHHGAAARFDVLTPSGVVRRIQYRDVTEVLGTFNHRAAYPAVRTRKEIACLS